MKPQNIAVCLAALAASAEAGQGDAGSERSPRATLGAHLTDEFGLGAKVAFLRAVDSFDPWNGVALVRGQCFSTDRSLRSDGAKFSPAEYGCDHLRQTRLAYGSISCGKGNVTAGQGWIIHCDGAPAGRFRLVASMPLDPDHRVVLAEGDGEPLHLSIAPLHDHLEMVLLSVGRDRTPRVSYYMWNAGGAARSASQE